LVLKARREINQACLEDVSFKGISTPNDYSKKSPLGLGLLGQISPTWQEMSYAQASPLGVVIY